MKTKNYFTAGLSEPLVHIIAQTACGGSRRFIQIVRFVLAILLLASSGRAQDIHFSQFYQAPLLLNPAMTGAFPGNVRAIVNYKDQWKSVATPYKTSAFSFDAALFKKKWKSAYLGAGLQVFNDKAGDAQLSTTALNVSLSSIVSINDNHKISAGLQGGGAQRSINASNPELRWDNQFDGTSYNPSIQPNETISEDPFLHGDFAAGVAWNYGMDASTLSSGNQIRLNAGAGYFHLNRPKQKFYGINPLYSKLVIHAGGFIGLNNTWLAFLPSVLYLQQGPSREINIGTMMRYTIKEESKYTGHFKESALSAGAYFRLGDAIIPALFFEYANYAIGINYDINASKLKQASSGKGGIEIALRYINPNPFRTGASKAVRFL